MINKQKAIVRLISWGAGIQSIRIPDRNGTMADVVLGFDDINGKISAPLESKRKFAHISEKTRHYVSSSVLTEN
jgi:galactose mutarotase-like enzyme